MTNDFWLGAIWTLACVLTGVLITLVFVAVLGDRGDPGPGIDPTPPPGYRPDLDRLEAEWLRENTVGEFPEVNLLP